MAVHGWRARDNRHDLKRKRFRLAKRRNFFTWRKVSHGSREVVQFPSLRMVSNLIWTSFEQEGGLDTSLGPFQCVLVYFLTCCLLRMPSVIKIVVNHQILPSHHLCWHWCYRPSLVLASLLGYIKEAFILIDVSKFHHLFLLLSFLYFLLLKHDFFALRGCLALRLISVQYGA